MDIDARRPVVVAVGDEDERYAAVRYAAAESVREARPLQVVHVVDPPFLGPGPDQLLIGVEDSLLVGEQLLRAAVEQAEDAVGGRVPVQHRLRHGRVVPVLVEISGHAHRMVLQHRLLSGPRRVFTGSVCSGVAGRASVPVVSVPELWSGDSASGRVAVGVDDSVEAHQLLEPAFALAAERGSELVVLHAWYIPTVYREAIIGRAAVERAREVVRTWIEEDLDVWRGIYPSVRARLEVEHVRPADALVAASERFGLLIVGRRSDPFSPAHLGPVTRAVVRESRCPVMVVPRPTPDAGGQVEAAPSHLGLQVPR